MSDLSEKSVHTVRTMCVLYRITNQDIASMTQEIRKFVLSKLGKQEDTNQEILSWLLENLGGKTDAASDPTNLEGNGGSLVIFEDGTFISEIFADKISNNVRVL